MPCSNTASSYHQTPSNDSVSTLGSPSAHLAPRLASSRGLVSLPSAYPDHHTTQPCSKSHREDDDHPYELPIVHPLTLFPSPPEPTCRVIPLPSSHLEQFPSLKTLSFSSNTPVFPHKYALTLGTLAMIRGQLDFGVFPTPSSQRCGAHTPLNPCEDPIGSGLLKARQRLCATCAQPSQHRVDMMMKDQSTLVDSPWPGVPHWFHCAPCRAQLRSMMLPQRLCDHQHLYITDESLICCLVVRDCLSYPLT